MLAYFRATYYAFYASNALFGLRLVLNRTLQRQAEKQLYRFTNTQLI
jgi:hypothetical protein